MAQGKKSVLLYCDLIYTIEKMDNETAGQFFKHYLRYINDQNPKTDNIVVDLTFEGVKQNLKRDLKKWELRAENSRKNGVKGGRPRKNPEKPNGLIENPEKPKKPVTVNVTVTDTVNVKKNISNREADFLKSLQPFLDAYGKDLLNEFYLYWTEKKPKGRKMKFEMQKTFDVSRRLARWKNNDYNNNKNLKAENNEKLKNITAGIRANNPNL